MTTGIETTFHRCTELADTFLQDRNPPGADYRANWDVSRRVLQKGIRKLPEAARNSLLKTIKKRIGEDFT